MYIIIRLGYNTERVAFSLFDLLAGKATSANAH